MSDSNTESSDDDDDDDDGTDSLTITEVDIVIDVCVYFTFRI